MPTVFDVLLQTARRLDAIVEGVATQDGDTYLLYDEVVGRRYKDDQFNQGCIFLKTNGIGDGVLTPVEKEFIGETTFASGSLSLYSHTWNRPLVAGSIALRIDTGVVTEVTDDGEGRADSPWIDNDNFLTAGSGPWSLSLGNIQPGSVRIKLNSTSQLTHFDNGEGYLVDATNNQLWATIDYHTGTITLIAGQPPLAGTSTESYKYALLRVLIDYQNGALEIRLAEPVDASFEIDYQHGYAAFLPLILNVTDFVSASGRIDFETDALTIGTSKGDLYGVMSNRFPRALLFSKLNEVLAEIRDYVAETIVDVSTLVGGYELAIGDEVRIVDVSAGNDASSDRDWHPLALWQHHGGRLRILSDLSAFTQLRYRYLTTAPAVAAETEEVTAGTPPVTTRQSTEISDVYSVSWLAAETAARCVRWRLQQPGAEGQLLTALLNQLLSDAQREKAKLRTFRPALLTVTQGVGWPER